MPERIEKLGPQRAREIAAIDVEARAGDFLPSLGEDFLTALYVEMLRGTESFAYGVIGESMELLGFVVGCTDTEAVFHRLSPVRNWAMFQATARALRKEPTRLVRMAESAFYTSKDPTHLPAELVVMGVKSGLRSHGFGAKLVAALAQDLAARGVSRYRVTVKTKNDGALRFYQKNHFRPAAEFRLYGEPWQILAAETKEQLAALHGNGESRGVSPTARPS